MTSMDVDVARRGWSPDECARYDRLRASTEPIVVSQRRGVHPNLIAWAKANGRLVPIDRDTKWGNPFRLREETDRARVIDAYLDYLVQNSDLLAAVGELTGKALACWCAPLCCHGDILAEAVRETVLYQSE